MGISNALPLKSQCTTQRECRKASPSAICSATCRIIRMQGSALGEGDALNRPLSMASCTADTSASDQDARHTAWVPCSSLESLHAAIEPQ